MAGIFDKNLSYDFVLSFLLSELRIIIFYNYFCLRIVSSKTNKKISFN
ncbi:hypothetical protein GCW_93396 [Mycoplasmoides gallisepticum S6]|uniref:Uncharacterized protein n=1 Tax=Mycoplasmoides gallisepticum S6 TaxID=1006581 RepID=A0A0F6CM29_MYCGL|nr:hypothetical protein GCW_93396 [Mycoplasmoides gallisepticum S6]